VSTRRIASVLAAAGVTAAVLWMYGTRGSGGHPAQPSPVPIQDGKTINFSNGSPVVGDSAADKAALDAGVKAIDAATRDITFPAQVTPTPAK
jgi:phosphoglycolate phosphatase-like HAD superfamily hydrolase